MKPTLYFILAAFLVGNISTQAQGTFIYDQQSTNLVEGSAGLQSGQPMGQSFTPSLSAVGFVMLNLYDGGSLPSGATAYVNLRSDSITGTVLGSTSDVGMPDLFLGVVTFVFPTPVIVTPGTAYYLQPIVRFGDGWGSYVTDGSYSGGTAIYQGVPIIDRDLWFREGIVVPEPRTWGLLLIGVSLLLFRKR